MKFRHSHDGQELSDFIWNKFNKQCFKCLTSLTSPKAMNLDHTRPLALLYPLDETATALCKECNSAKRDKSPKDYYTSSELERLAILTGIPIDELQNPTPNLDALAKIIEKKEWLLHTFVNKPELTKIREGKRASDLLIKALNKVFSKAGYGDKYL